MTLRWLALIPLVAGCDRPSPAKVPAPAVAVAPVVAIDAAPMDAVPEGTLPAAVSDEEVARVCAGRAPCRRLAGLDAGRDGAGTPLRVVVVGLFAAPADGEEPADCGPVEHWALIGQPVRSIQKLAATCSVSTTAVDVGAAVGVNHLSAYGGGEASWKRSTWWRTVQLSPPQLVDVETTWEDLDAGEDVVFTKSKWSWATFAGSGERGTLPCDDGEAPATGPASFRARWAAIPQVDLPAAYTGGRWRSASPGACALHVDATAPEAGGDRGAVIHGEPGGGDDARLSVVAAADRVLYLEIRDDTLVTGGPRWILDDHVELWAASGGEADCTPAKGDARQWGIALDGTVTAAHGKPGPLRVEAARAGDVVRLRVRMPDDLDAVTVVYSDSDDGARQERLIATSRLVFGKAWSLGAYQRVEPADMTCELVGAALTPRHRRRFAPDVAMIPE